MGQKWEIGMLASQTISEKMFFWLENTMHLCYIECTVISQC